jgi:hypothetical protein
MNITFNIIKEDSSEDTVTFYTIAAIGKGPTTTTSIIYSNGMQFTCTLTLSELWDKVKRINDESATRK